MNNNPWYVYLLAALIGVVAGIINTLAGSGSLLTLPMLTFLGLPSPVANATNRIGVLFQNIVGTITLKRSGRLNLAGAGWLLGPSLVGGLVGALLAANISKRSMDITIGVVMIVMLIVILLEPKRWLREQSEVKPGRPHWGILVLFFFLGVYGGFIQAGIGIFLLAAMVLGCGYNLVDANGLKLILVLGFTIVAVVVFASGNQIRWEIGLLMAAGQSVGAWAAARFAARAKKANVYIRWLLIIVIVASIWKMF
ncbi:MAG: sulfite exporter TauE/SafE family protein, partial [Chloroflexi bacterium]|nr:sulfite exporter TauE/SafE family protein [Chloroflexota bacterium]